MPTTLAGVAFSMNQPTHSPTGESAAARPAALRFLNPEIIGEGPETKPVLRAMASPLRSDELLFRENLELKQRLEEQSAELARANRMLRQEIKERRQIELAFHESEERFMAFMNNSPTMAFIKDERGCYIYGNRRWESFFGEKPAAGKERHDFDLYPAKTAERMREEDRHILATGKCSETIRSHPTADGRFNSWLVIKFPILDPHGRPFIGGIAVDITERKRAAAVLKAHDVQQAAIAEFGQRALAGADPQSLMEDCAALVVATLGVDFCDIWELQEPGKELWLRAGLGWKKGMVGRARMAAEGESQAAFALGQHKPVMMENLGEETRFKPTQLLQNHGVVSGLSLIIPGIKKPFGILGAQARKQRRFNRDEIHFLRAIANVLAAALERKRAEEALRHSENTLADFFDNAPLGLHWLGPDGHILRANKAELRMLGLRAEDYIGHHISEFHADQPFIQDLLKKLRNNETGTHEARLCTKDGSIKHVLIDANVLWENGRFVHARCFTRDVTDRRQRERQILEISEREQQRIGQDLHDDLCQYLAAIKFKNGLLKRMLAVESPAQARSATTIETMLNSAIDRAHRLARGLHPVQLEADGLSSALTELAANLTELYHRACRCQIRKPVLIYDNAVAVHLYRIAQEAMTNAIKHGRARQTLVTLATKGERIVLSVEDNGIGLPAKLSHKTGMGLHIMNYRARMIGATLSLERIAAGGTLLTCAVPGANLPPAK